MAKSIISYINQLFQKNESKDYKIQVYNLDGLVLLVFKELADLKQTAQEDNNNPLQPHDSEDLTTKE